MDDTPKIAFTVEEEVADVVLTLLDELVALLDAIQAGPVPDDLATSPLLETWQPLIDTSGVPVLSGTVTGDEELQDGTIILTARLLGLDPDRLWARTEDSWYRLVDPMSFDEAEAARRLGAEAEETSVSAFDYPDHIQISNGPFLDRLLVEFDLRLRRLRDVLARAMEEARALRSADADSRDDDGGQSGAEGHASEKPAQLGAGNGGPETGDGCDGQPR